MNQGYQGFRFEKLHIWQELKVQSTFLFEIADRARKKSYYRFGEQLDGATLGISNNIAEGSGASSKKEFARYLSIARASLYEVVNLLHFYEARGLLSQEERLNQNTKLQKLSRQLYALRPTLLKPN